MVQKQQPPLHKPQMRTRTVQKAPTQQIIQSTPTTGVILTPVLVPNTPLIEISLPRSARGAFYTWSNKHESGTKVYSRIDRVFINDEWTDIFPDGYVHFLLEGTFDHCPCLVNFEVEHQRRGATFKYFNMWSLAPGYSDIVRTSSQRECQGTPMYRVVTKLKGLKSALKKLNKEQFDKIENLTHVAELSLQNFQELLILDPLNEQLCQNEQECAKEVIKLRKARHQFLSQKAKCEWMKFGDENTSYFHANIRRRISKNRVFQIKDMNNTMCTTPDSIKAAFEKFYQKLLATSNDVTSVNHRVVQKGPCIIEGHYAILNAPVTAEEVKKVMFDIQGTKAPGPDGYSSQFFKDNRDIVGHDVIAAVK
ncbi:uncharacterized protein LOC141644876 [Silene latifolia]|uniref:uncharacterized protein LOC141644876 n=1 Tax=Silene latifolia TaxID=37657 RepID=UPI003D777398